MEQTIQTFLTQGVFAFMLTFARIGAAATIMPGIGDSFVPQNIRLYIALGISLVLMPMVAPYLPNPMPSTAGLLVLIGGEFIIGIFIGTIARIMMTALDTAGMVEVVKALRARLILPMHYFNQFTLNRFLDKVRGDFPIEMAETNVLEISQAKLPSNPKILVLPGM